MCTVCGHAQCGCASRAVNRIAVAVEGAFGVRGWVGRGVVWCGVKANVCRVRLRLCFADLGAFAIAMLLLLLSREQLQFADFSTKRVRPI